MCYSDYVLEIKIRQKSNSRRKKKQKNMKI